MKPDAPGSQTPVEPARRRGCLRRLVILVVIAGAAFLLGRTFLVQRITVPDNAVEMSPALERGAPAWLDKIGYRISSPRRGDIVAVKTQSGLVISRIVGLPGETVGAREGTLTVDGAAAAESYVYGSLPADFELTRVPRGSYFVLPDDRSAYAAGWAGCGLVPRGNIVGRVLPAER